MATQNKTRLMEHAQPAVAGTRKKLLAVGKVASHAAIKRVSLRGPIAASKAKAHFLQLLEEVERDRQPITITKRGRIVAQLTPASEPQAISAFDQVFGSMTGSVKISGDLVSPDWDAWGQEWR